MVERLAVQLQAGQDCCVVCGRNAGLRAKVGADCEPICADCLDARWPALQLGSLARSFSFPRGASGECPHCGCTDSQAIESGLVGCTLCYEALSATVWREFGLLSGSAH